MTVPNTRFAILEHDRPFVHWDLFLEEGAVLKSWRLLEVPLSLPVEAEPIKDHRIHYLTYEGPVSHDRGTVKRWDAGQYELIERSCDAITVRLFGSRLHGMFQLTRRASDDQEDTVRWTLSAAG